MSSQIKHYPGNPGRFTEDRLNKHGSVLNAVLIMLAQHALLIAISSDLNAYGVVCEFDWNDGNGQEGWPSMDGSEGIRITDIDTSGIFDSDDMTIKAA
ncbi:Lambda prophage-derived protein ea10 [Escherichia coli]|nr:Lambda prophage-derived protein ea10 [Escherichia coli]